MKHRRTIRRAVEARRRCFLEYNMIVKKKKGKVVRSARNKLHTYKFIQ